MKPSGLQGTVRPYRPKGGETTPQRLTELTLRPSIHMSLRCERMCERACLERKSDQPSAKDQPSRVKTRSQQKRQGRAHDGVQGQDTA